MESIYYVGTLCRRGHRYEGTPQSLRYRNGGSCVECRRERNISRRTRPDLHVPPREMSDTEAAWLAGLLEGEGCFVLKSERQGGFAAVKCTMTDLDVLERIRHVTGVGGISERATPPGRKLSWTWTIGHRRVVAHVCRAVLPYMGERRSKRIREILDVLAAVA